MSDIPAADAGASVHRGAQSAPELLPVVRQRRQLLRLIGKLAGDHVQQQNFLVEQDHVSIRQNAFVDHRSIAVIGLAAEDYSLIGFGWGHRNAA